MEEWSKLNGETADGLRDTNTSFNLKAQWVARDRNESRDQLGAKWFVLKFPEEERALQHLTEWFLSTSGPAKVQN